MSLSVVIPAYNQAHSLRLALTSLAAQTLSRDQFELVIVDDCGAENLGAVVAEFAGVLDIQYLRNPENLGRARTRNRGITAARHDDLLLLDADSYCTPDLLARHHEFGDRADGHILLGRRLEPEWDTLAALIGGQAPDSHRPSEEDPRYQLGFEPDVFAASRTPWLFAYCNNMSISRKLLDVVGGFNEEFVRWGYEDNELAYRIFRHQGRAAGYFQYDPDALTYHLPHYRNWRADWAGAQGYLPYMKDRYRHFDVEFLGAPPQRVARAVPFYEECLELLRGRSAAVELSDVDLWFGFDVGGPGPRCDHAAPPDEDNLHLLGVWTPFADGQFDRVANVDLWRMLSAADMSALLLEGLRVARELVLVWTTAIGAPFAADLGYVVEMLRGHCRLTVSDDDGRGYTVLRATAV